MPHDLQDHPHNRPTTFRIVVGDLFASIAQAFPDVITETAALDMIQFEPLSGHGVELILGQGVDRQMIDRAVRHRTGRDPQALHHFHIFNDESRPRATRRLAHKDKPGNICVSTPVPVAQDHYRLDLHFSASNEFFADHMTGMHIQGMALTEAARQAFLAVTELHFLNTASGRNYYFVIKSMTSRFDGFVFPLAAHLDYHIRRSSLKDSHSSFDVEMELFQAGTRCARFEASFTAFEASRIATREAEMMAERVADLIAARQQAHLPGLEAITLAGASFGLADMVTA